MTHDREAFDVSTLDALLVEASALMKAGLRLLDDARPEAVAEALDCFDRALERRRHLPIDQFPVLRYDLAACWLNRAEALVRLGGDDRIAAALQGYDEAIGLLRAVPLDEDPRYPRRLAIACQNRGLLLHALGAQGAREAHAAPGALAGGVAEPAISSLTEAIAVLDRHGSQVPDRQQLLAAIWMNLANVRIGDGHEREQDRDTSESRTLGRRAAAEAIALVHDLETQDADAADVGLKARHVLCRALAATCLTDPPPTEAKADALTDAEVDATTHANADATNGATTGVTADDVHEATDLADEALALVQHWEQRGVPHFRALAHDFFRFGAHVYARYQPHFLQEFIRDHLNPAHASPDYINSPEMQAAAQDVSTLLTRVTYYVTLSTTR